MNRYFEFYKTYKQMSPAKVSSIVTEFLRGKRKKKHLHLQSVYLQGEMSYLCNYYTVGSFVSIEIMTQLI